MLPPGDIRNCIVALSEDEALLSRLFQHRFVKDQVSKAIASATCFWRPDLRHQRLQRGRPAVVWKSCLPGDTSIPPPPRTSSSRP
jgi:hypothetical protein